jgi:hypothetical protein
VTAPGGVELDHDVLLGAAVHHLVEVGVGERDDARGGLVLIVALVWRGWLGLLLLTMSLYLIK